MLHVPFSKHLPVAQVSFLFNNGNFCSPGQGLALLVTCSVKWENLCFSWLAYVSVNAHVPFSSKWSLNFHLLMTLHVLTTGHREIKLVLIGKLPPCCFTFLVLGGAMQVSRGEKGLTALPTHCEVCNDGHSRIFPLVQLWHK